MSATVRHLFSGVRHPDETAAHRKSLSWSRGDNEAEARGRQLRELPRDSKDTLPPPPPPKDRAVNNELYQTDGGSSSTPTSSVETVSLFRPGHPARAGSIYSISRVSFTSQISQLTAIPLPDATSLSKSLSSIPSAEVAARALKDAASQIQIWIQKATDVLDGLDAGDDAEWAAAAGREGVVEVDLAVKRFEILVNTYVDAVEDLQLRDDASAVPAQDLRGVVEQVERITDSWSKIKASVIEIKRQVEVALEWEDFRDTVLGDIGAELDILSTLVFELEEARHESTLERSTIQDEHLEIGELETLVNESPLRIVHKLSQSNRSGEPGRHQPSPLPFHSVSTAPDDSSLLGLFARMQPLGACLDLLPQQLEKFKDQANVLFPSACQDLEDGRETLEAQWLQLEMDAESLRKELGEDKWNGVFRNASKRALKMIDSVERSLTKVDESLENDTRLRHAAATVKQLEQYEAKKLHYCPAIDRVLDIVEMGVKDRLTVNGEILRLRAELRQRWQTLQRDMKSMDSLLEEYASDTGVSQQQLRDSVSTILSTTGGSVDGSTLLTPGSSPPSSLEVSRSSSTREKSRTYLHGKPRQLSANPSTPSITSSDRRFSSLPLPKRKTPLTRSDAVSPRSTGWDSSPLSTSKSTSSRITSKTNTPADNRPRWSYGTQRQDYDVTEYYRRLKSKTSTLHQSHTPRQSSAPGPPLSSLPAPTPVPYTRTMPLGNHPKPPSRNTSRPPLRHKRSDILPSTNPFPAYTSAGIVTPSPKLRSRSSMASRPPSQGPATGNQWFSAEQVPSMLPTPSRGAGAGAGWSSPVVGARSRRTSTAMRGRLE